MRYIIVIPVIFSLLFQGCGLVVPFTRNSLKLGDEVRAGMTRSEIVAEIGEPNEIVAGAIDGSTSVRYTLYPGWKSFTFNVIAAPLLLGLSLMMPAWPENYIFIYNAEGTLILWTEAPAG